MRQSRDMQITGLDPEEPGWRFFLRYVCHDALDIEMERLIAIAAWTSLFIANRNRNGSYVIARLVYDDPTWTELILKQLWLFPDDCTHIAR